MYLYGHHVTVYNDHLAVQVILNIPTIDREIFGVKKVS